MTKSSNPADRLSAFEELSQFVGNKAASLPNFRIFEKIIQIHFDHIDDSDEKVCLRIIDSLKQLVESFGDTLSPYLGDIVPKVIAIYSRTEVMAEAEDFFRLMLNRYGGESLLEFLFETLDSRRGIEHTQLLSNSLKMLDILLNFP